MGEQTPSLDLVYMNSMFCSMEISQPKDLTASVPKISNQVELIEIVDDDDPPKIMSQVCTVHEVEKKSMKKRKIHNSPENIFSENSADESILISDDEPMEVDFSNKIISEANILNLSINNSFINYRRTKKKKELHSTHPVVLDETISLEEEIPLEVKDNVDEVMPANTKRVLRKRIQNFDTVNSNSNSAKVKKNDYSSVVEKYLNKKVKRLPSTLETIFEEPKQENNEELYVSKRKLKRALFFQDAAQTNKLKSKKRINKAKKYCLSKKFIYRKRISMETLMNKLVSLESDTL